MPLFTDLSLKLHDVLQCLGNLFIISALQNNRTAVHRRYQLAVCVAGSEMNWDCQCIGTVAGGQCQTGQGRYVSAVTLCCVGDVRERERERELVRMDHV